MKYPKYMLLTLGLIAFLQHQAAWAQRSLPEWQSSPNLTVPELGQPVTYDFTVYNNTANTMLLDWGFVGISPSGDDTALFPTFASINPVILPGQKDIFAVTFTVQPKDPPGTPIDENVSPITFESEWSPLVGQLYGVAIFPGNDDPAAIVVTSGDNYVPSANYAADYASLLSQVGPNPLPLPTEPLYVGGLIGRPTCGNLTVYDTPDRSSTLALLGVATLSLLACDWRRRMAKA